MLYVSRSPLASSIREQGERIQRAFEIEWQRCWQIRVPAAVVGLVALGLLATALWSPLVNSPGDCQTPPLVFKPDTSIETLMTVSHDRACSLYVSPGSAMINALAVTAPPSFGSLNARGRTGVVYRSPVGFNGEETFVFTIAGKMREDIAAMTVKVRVNVK